ncbi:MAG: hypothetical protein RIF32_04130 [Leptospirales bacterium]|jgi:hypothetical protein
MSLISRGFEDIKRRLAGNADDDRLRETYVAKIKAGELDGRAEVVKAQLVADNPEVGDRADTIVHDILKAAIANIGKPAPEAAAETKPAEEQREVQKADSTAPAGGEDVARLTQAVGELIDVFKGFAAAQKDVLNNQNLIGSGIGLLLDAQDTAGADLGVLKSDLSGYLSGVAPGARPVETAAAPATPGERLSKEEQRLIHKGIYDGRFGSLDVGLYEQSGRSRADLPESMREFLSENKPA